jgi:hypothetical protein
MWVRAGGGLGDNRQIQNQAVALMPTMSTKLHKTTEMVANGKNETSSTTSYLKVAQRVMWVPEWWIFHKMIR